uniref:Pleckstrin homology, MyTH4 and FERM domain containing H3 n=1 Tax=Pundamilia nyererei TaxID=303518 RepID=A0A3B4FT49_9CICH
MPLQGVCWFLCCRQGFSLLGRDYGEKEEEESFELRNKEDLTPNGRVSESSEEMKSLIIDKNKMGQEEEPELLVKWLLREVRGNWIKQRRYWFVLTQDSLDYYTGPEKGARRLGTLVLTNLCSVIWPDKQTYKETYWSITVYGRKHCYRLYTKHFNEAVHWACAIQKIIDSKSPVETPTQLLIRDIEENKFNPEVVEHIYQHNPILKYTQGPLYAPLLPFPYGSLEHTHSGKGYGSVREEAVKLFNCLQQLESAREPVPIIQGVLQTCLDLRPLRDEVYCQLVKQTSYTPSPNTAAHLRYWQLLTCMSCTFLPGPIVLKYLRFHLKIQSQSPESEMDNYASFISEALEKTKCRECVPSWEEIQMLMNRQEMLCTVHYPGPGSCQLYISSHTTANEVVRRMQEKLGLQESKNTFALYEQNALWEQPVTGSALVADILTRFEKVTCFSTKESESKSQWKLCFKLYCLLDADSISVDSIEYLFLFEQCHEMVVRGQLPACEEDLQALAALRLQSLMGDFSTHAPCPPLDELFPGHMLETRVLMSISAPQDVPPCQVAAQGCPTTQRFHTGLLAGTLWSHTATAVHKQKVEQDMRLRTRLKEEAAAVMTSILERWKGLAGYSRRDSMAAYLTIARQWSGFGCTLYEVDFYIQSSTGSFSQKLWLGVAATSVSLYKQGESEALESFPYGQICSYGVSDSNTFKITAGDRDLLFETTKLTEIMQLMNAYFSAIHRQRGKGEDADSTEVGFRHLRSAPTPTLLELPSHPV